MVNDPPVGNSQEAFMMEMRTARMLIKEAASLCSCICLLCHLIHVPEKDIFSGFASLNDYVKQRIVEFNQQAEKSDRTLSRIAEEAAASLKELKSHYYSSSRRLISQNLSGRWL
ncbi:hypothetical protein EUGRSUZ_L02967 [Eucalyptus grandis]|uniref:Uncharacterized protein n=1 Tax=Eucalyptus grandis TaxID=71139 RepID=A0AAD9WIM2_EUCGR|nr:hypothetical protein EUGRSUZ_L02967 [Eucalyptus grandis]